MTAQRSKPATYLSRLLTELEKIREALGAVLEASTIQNIDLKPPQPSRHICRLRAVGVGISDNTLERARMALLCRIRDWGPRFRMLYPPSDPDCQQAIGRQPRPVGAVAGARAR